MRMSTKNALYDFGCCFPVAPQAMTQKEHGALIYEKLRGDHSEASFVAALWALERAGLNILANLTNYPQNKEVIHIFWAICG